MRESVNTAFRSGQLVNAAYAVAPTDLGNRAGQIVNAGAPARAYEVITSIYANDLATDMNSDRRSQRISIGLILQASAGDVVLAPRASWSGSRMRNS